MGGGVIILPGVTAPEVCKIYLKVEAPGFADRTLFAQLPILKENDVAWDHYERVNNYFYPGEVISAGAITYNDPPPQTMFLNPWMSRSVRWTK